MNNFITVVCAIAACASAGQVRKKRNFFHSLQYPIGISSGYGGAYGTYGDYTIYSRNSAPVIGYSAPIGEYHTPASHSTSNGITNNALLNPPQPLNVQKIEIKKVLEVPQSVKVHEVVSVPQVTVHRVVTTPSYTADGYIGYGSGVTSGYFGYSDYSHYSGYSRHPGYSGYATGHAKSWW